MSEIWSILGKARLQELIGETVLARLEKLLPALNPDFDQNKIYSSEGLAQVFEAFAGASALEKSEFRKELFDSLPPKKLDGLVEQLVPAKVREVWPKKVQALAAQWTKRQAAEVIAQHLGISKDLVPQDLTLPPSETVIETTDSAYKTLKDYQSGVYFKACEKLDVPRSRFILQMPTGSGKTRTAIEIVCDFLNRHETGTVVVWLVHSEELCEQAYESFLQIWPHLCSKALRLVRYWGDGRSLPFDFSESAFIVGSFPKLYALLKSRPGAFTELAPKVGLVVVDEAHKVLARTYNQVVSALLGSETRVLGLTATPGRSLSNAAENRSLAEFFFNDILSIHSGEIPVIDFLRARGVLSETEYVPLVSGRRYELSAREKDYIEQFFELPPGLLRRVGNDDVRNVEIVKRLEKECKAQGRIIFFGCSVEHSKFITALLNFLGFKAAHIDGTTNRARRQALIKSFKASELQVLCNYGILSTGFDAPQITVVFIARPTGSIVLYSQMIGRGLRGPAIGGTAQCKIVDVIDNISGFSDERSVYDYFADYYSTTSEV
jgi:DNA repair protein RadD